MSTHLSACSLTAFPLAVRFRYICFCILLNLAEDIAIEKKMCKRGIVEFLGKGEQGAVMQAPYLGSHTRPAQPWHDMQCRCWTGRTRSYCCSW